ncbi:hypothetical protein J5N97_015636 [Dioscorea zingiberensis]|uniref:Heptahelical transmembrane protein 4-like n=1 Tax=Dioscorea zingiberensis TaxID=325984 RepID=A0A9D5CHX7_9LILI|nr:hypothetical protein J5N97_015636 [Dioscorea zingiberensis]
MEVKSDQLMNYNSLPEYLKDNEFILDYYRPEWPLKKTILSIFSIHNETLNVWTHLIGFFIFLFLTIATAVMIPREDHETIYTLIRIEELSSSNNNTIINTSSLMMSMISPMLTKPIITRWPFFAFLFGAMLCLLTSSLCHLLISHSEKMAYIMLRLDYTGIASLIVTSFYPPVFYCFICDPFFLNLYMSFITIFGVATVIVSLLPVFQTAQFRNVRAALFFSMGVSGVVPIMHKLIVFGDRPEAVLSVWYELLMGMFYGLGVIVYAARVPERWIPGRFDLVGHSHQLFHLLVLAGAYTHYLAGLVYLRWRDVHGC